jgi:hypothetical protein
MFDGTIHRGDYPLLLNRMREDGLDYTHTLSGLEWQIYSKWGEGNYKVLPSAIQRAWGINQSTWRRFVDWIIEVK